MFKFLFVLFFFFLLLLSLLGFSVLRTFKHILFGKGNSNGDKGGQRRQTTSSNRGQSQSSKAHQNEAPRKKIIAEDEGEYVDYEEVK
ncbi:DUF4834 family protein [Massilibacteroides sp.]|uniref:DUF4834 family protein n=1 Tax=Massilibacteroides sp. TaxID=2034766 RepID=UPI002638B2DD|nr:DUF4834 family protein [Massilibacteroides sp.]MDD4516183.1 DUF4834 family protein [Massilibacteroides sp.]